MLWHLFCSRRFTKLSYSTYIISTFHPFRAKRRTLEDPELYQIEKHLTKSEQRNHRKMVRCKLSEMPGKLDHATVVAFKVGIWPSDDGMYLKSCTLRRSLEDKMTKNKEMIDEGVTSLGECL